MMQEHSQRVSAEAEQALDGVGAQSCGVGAHEGESFDDGVGERWGRPVGEAGADGFLRRGGLADLDVEAGRR
jgi:hypothetical protein